MASSQSLSDQELVALLITCDGKGKEEKLAALEELLERKYSNGYDNGYAVGENARTLSHD